MIPRPAPSEYAPYYGRYVALVPEDDVLAFLDTQKRATQALLKEVGEERGGHRYAPDKWSIKQVVGHLTDAERVFAYRALVISRSDRTPQAGFEQDDWVTKANHDQRPLADVAAEFAAVREATLSLGRSFSDEMWGRTGVASDCSFTARALLFIIAGHEVHHVGVLRERYLT